ncbi:MAG: DUF3137 domain-containing protein [Syntrophorhabdaceae bacterium]|nr:DUF3137 domain-containing protein [Syntrophorhabdaceae bacterium]
MAKDLAEFKAFYETKLIRAIQQAEDMRQEVYSAYLWAWIKAVLLCLFIFFSLYATRPYMKELSTTLYVAFYIASFVICLFLYKNWVRGIFDEFNNYYNINVIDKIVKFVEPSCQYAPEGYIPIESFKLSQLFSNNIDLYSGSDLISGKIGETSFTFSQIHALRKEEHKYTNHEGKEDTITYWITLFSGIFYVADFNKHFNSKVLLMPKKGRYAFYRWKNRITLEDPEFMSFYNVYADDPVEARYILSTSLMRRIMELIRRAQREIYISFVSPHIYIGIPNPTNFRPYYSKNLIGYPTYETYFFWLSYTIGIVDVLDLNTRIWSKMPRIVL